MTEDTLKQLPVVSLFNLMIETTDELMAMNRKENETAMQVKKEEVELMQKIIIAKRVEFAHGFSIQEYNL